MILIIDNNIEIRFFLKWFLEKNGFETITAKDGVDANEKINTFPVSMVLSEIQLPLLNGFELLKKVQNNLKGKKLPCWFFVTSHSEESYQEESERLGANHFLSKPYDHDHLLSLIKTKCPNFKKVA